MRFALRPIKTVAMNYFDFTDFHKQSVQEVFHWSCLVLRNAVDALLVINCVRREREIRAAADQNLLQ
ncbi:UNVERIFIED_ORG: hypothetical protein ABIC54_001178 [Burkholderia sp. 1263]